MLARGSVVETMKARCRLASRLVDVHLKPQQRGRTGSYALGPNVARRDHGSSPADPCWKSKCDTDSLMSVTTVDSRLFARPARE